MYAMVAAMQRDGIKKSTKRTLQGKQLRFEKVGQTWYGFKVDESILQTQEGTHTFGKGYKLIPDEKEYPMVLQMMELQDKGLSYQAITDHINNLGYKTREGTPFAKMTIWRILKRRKMYQAHLDPSFQPSL